VFYSITMILKASDVSIIIKLAISLIIAGILMIVFNQFKGRKKEKEEEDDFSKY
jgi:hypothetical protein